MGFITPAGVSAQFGVILLMYLKQAWDERTGQGKPNTDDLLDAIGEGAVLRVRPNAMTVAVILAGRPPMMWGTGTDFGDDATICRAKGGPHNHRTAAADVCEPSRAPADAAAAGGEPIPPKLLEVATCGELSAWAQGPAEP